MATYIGNGKIRIDGGDTLWAIYGSNWQQASGYTGDPRRLQVGTVLPAPSHMVPKSEKASAPASQSQPAPSTEKAQQDLVKLAADIVDEWEAQQEKALADIGSFTYDKNKLLDQAMTLIQPYFDSRLKELVKQIGEQRVRTQEEYDQVMREIATQADSEIKKLDIINAETDEQLTQRLADIGATTDFSLEQARISWGDRIESEMQGKVEAGLGFAGQTAARKEELGRRQGLETGEIARRGGVQQEQAETSAFYTKERARVARETVEATRADQEARALLNKEQGERMYGTGALTVPTSTAGLNFKDIGQYGLGISGEMQLGDLIRNRDASREAQYNQLYEHERDMYEQARQDALAGVPDFNSFFNKEFSKRATI